MPSSVQPRHEVQGQALRSALLSRLSLTATLHFGTRPRQAVEVAKVVVKQGELQLQRI